MRSRRSRKPAAIIFSIAVLITCGIGSIGSFPINTMAAEGAAPGDNANAASPGPLGVAEDKSPGLTGTDADKNGIRDDVDAFISLKYSASEPLRKAAQQDARSTQMMLNATTKEQASAAAAAQARAVNCDFASAPNAKVAAKLSRELEALTVNTEERIRAYTQANAYLNHTILPSANGKTCD